MFDDIEVPSSMLTQIIIDETLQENLIQKKQLKEKKASALSTGHQYGKFPGPLAKVLLHEVLYELFWVCTNILFAHQRPISMTIILSFEP